jgi:16S rRNA (adenine1518-N6/adenine1519-N6)-dimethyltransferase
VKSPQLLCRIHDLRPRKQLGQNFLADPTVAQAIVDRADIRPDDLVVEIGPGLGALTVPLARAAQAVFAIEKDPSLARILREELADGGVSNVEVVTADVLEIDWGGLFPETGRPFTVFGNLPYNISSQVVVRLIASRRRIPRAVLMFQKELAARLKAAPGGRDYGRITAMLHYCAEVRRVAVVTASRFFPQPKVDSEVLGICFRPPPPDSAHDEERLFQLIAAAFGQRRKTLKKALSSFAPSLGPRALAQALTQAGIDPNRRAETLSPGEFVALEISLRRTAPDPDTERRG